MSPGRSTRRYGYHALIVGMLVSIPLTVFVGSDSWLVSWFWRLLPIGAAFVMVRRRRWIGVALGVAALAVALSDSGSPGWFAAAAAFGFTGAVLLFEVFRHRVVTGETVSGALCAYLLIGVTFALLFGAVELQAPGSVVGGSAGAADVAEMVYFSFVTLTTVGYGDVAPVSGAARGLAILEALLGQLFLVAVVARFVGRQSLDWSPVPGPDSESDAE